MRILSGSATDFLADFLADVLVAKHMFWMAFFPRREIHHTPGHSFREWCGYLRSATDFLLEHGGFGGGFSVFVLPPGWRIFFARPIRGGGFCPPPLLGVVDVAAKGLHTCTQGEDSTRNQSNRKRGSAHGPFSFCQAEPGDTPPGSDWETGHDVLIFPHSSKVLSARLAFWGRSRGRAPQTPPHALGPLSLQRSAALAIFALAPRRCPLGPRMR